MKLLLTISIATAMATEPSTSRVVLMGGSSVFTSYLPDEFKQQTILKKELEKQYGEGKAEVLNWADNGLYIARYLITQQYDRHRKEVGGVDLFIIRFGTNDAKRTNPKEFGEHLETLLDLLAADYPDAKFILEDGIYLDYPAHYIHDRNLQLNPYWAVTHEIAQRRGLPISPLYALSKKITEEGNWDLRIRKQIKSVIVMDDSKDAEHAGDISWFTDIHPNPKGVQVAVDAEMSAIKTLFPEQLPTGGQKAEQKERSPEEYIRLLKFSPDRLQEPAKVNPDQLQKSMN